MDWPTGWGARPWSAEVALQFLQMVAQRPVQPQAELVDEVPPATNGGNTNDDDNEEGDHSSGDGGAGGGRDGGGTGRDGDSPGSGSDSFEKVR